MKSNASIWLHRLLWMICIASLLTAVSLSYWHLTVKESIYAKPKADLIRMTVDATRKIDAVLQQAMESAHSLADGLTSGEISHTDMHERLTATLLGNENYFGGTITFAPYGYDPDTRLYSAYYWKTGTNDGLEYLQLADVYDYTTPEYDWYVEPMAKGDRWGEPYWDAAGKTYMITYSARFYDKETDTAETAPNGVVTIDISMARIKDIIESLDIGPSGFGALTTRDGNYLYHPNYEYVQRRLNIRDVAREKNDLDRFTIAEKAARGEGGLIEHTSTTTGEASWLIFESVPTSGWSLQNTFIKSDLAIDFDTLRRQIIWIMIATLVFVVSLSSLVLRVNLGTPERVWVLNALVSVVLVVGISVMWYLALTFHSATGVGGVKVADKASLRTVMNHYQQASERKHLKPPLFIPTGLYIDAIEFNNANDVLVTGSVWQHYPENFPREVARGIQIGRAKSVRIETIGAHPVENGEVLRWTFQAELRVPIDYSRYPLEVEHLDMQLLPLATNQSIVLVPYLDSYKLTTATLLPGLDDAVFLPGWKLTESFFVLRVEQKNTNFGIEQNFDRETLPTLYFSVGLKRVFIDAFISNLKPLIIVAVVLFALVLLSRSVEVGRIMSVCVAVFFVVVFSHLDIRKHIAAGEIFYLEYFYFVIYFAIILVPMDAFRIALQLKPRFFEAHDGLLPRVTFWPSILGIFFAITVMKFY